MKPQLLILCAATVLLTAQDALAAKCSLRTDTNDFFSGVPTTRTEWKPLNMNACPGHCEAFGVFSMVTENGVHRLEFDVLDSDKPSFVFVPTQEDLDNALIVPDNATLEFTLADGSVVELPMLEVVKTFSQITYPYENGSDNYFIVSGAGLRFTLDSTAMNALGAQKASSVRVLGANQSLNIPLDRRSQDYFKDAAACLVGGES